MTDENNIPIEPEIQADNESSHEPAMENTVQDTTIEETQMQDTPIEETQMQDTTSDENTVQAPVQNADPVNNNTAGAAPAFRNYNPYDTNNQYAQFRQYSRQYGQYAPQYQSHQHGQQYQMQYGQQYQQQPVQPKKGAAVPLTDSQKKIVLLLRISVILIALIFVYCIISDTISYRNHIPSESSASDATSEKTESSDGSVVIYHEGKPDSAKKAAAKADENGRYTVEGIAAAVSPSIVQITAYSGNTKGSTGSGIILTEDGYILTNAHVVSQFSTFEVELYGIEEPYEAELIGYDSKSDLAVVHVNASDLVPAVIGDSDELNVGEEVVAIGNPAGLTGSVTRGIVSALDRQIRSGNTGFYMDCIQTDAAISPGNSGGALVNMYGQVVGVTSSKYANAYYGGTYEGLGFAISINQALPIAEELISQGYIGGRVKIGITFAALENEYIQAEFAEAFNLEKCPYSEGIWITEISEDCDIANTELSVYDVILSVNGTKVNNYDELLAVINECKAGDVLTAECRTFSFGNGEKDFKAHDYTIEFELMEDTSGDY